MVANYKLSLAFGKSNEFAVCSIFFPYICLPILAFGSSEYKEQKQAESFSEIFNSNSNNQNNNQNAQNNNSGMVNNSPQNPMPESTSTDQNVNPVNQVQNTLITNTIPPIVTSPEPVKKFCPNCGTPNNAESVFCKNCGTKLL